MTSQTDMAAFKARLALSAAKEQLIHLEFMGAPILETTHKRIVAIDEAIQALNDLYPQELQAEHSHLIAHANEL